jgi:hypothetical protein
MVSIGLYLIPCCYIVLTLSFNLSLHFVSQGMSFSNRDSLWANSACVVTVAPDDPILDKYKTHG